jgi:peroxiredoxin
MHEMKMALRNTFMKTNPSSNSSRALAVHSALVAFFAVANALAPSVEAAGAKFNKVLSIGDAAPEWTNLPGVDDKLHNLSDYREAKVIVMVFTCNHCPVAKMYEERLVEFARKYERKVQVVAISVSHHGADGLEKMKARAAERGMSYQYLYDESQKSARSYGATVTPHFFVLNGERQIAYMGAFDDNFEPDRVEKHYLTDAVEALLAGNEPRVKESLQRGCAIDYE